MLSRDRFHLLADAAHAVGHCSSVDLRPLCEICAAFCALSETGFGFLAGHLRGLADFLHRGRGFAHGGRRFAGARGELRGGGDDLAGRRAEHCRALDHAADLLAQIVDMRANALPNTSADDCGCSVARRSPAAICSALPRHAAQRSVMRSKARLEHADFVAAFAHVDR